MKISGCLAGFLAASLLGVASASAAPIALPSGPVYGTFFGVEQVAPANNTAGVGSPYLATSGTVGANCTGCVQEPTPALNKEGTFGVFIVGQLYPGTVGIPGQQIDQTGVPFFNNGGGGSTFGPQITGMFYGTTITSFTAGPGSLGQATGNGGIVDLYWWDKNNQTQTATDAANPGILRTAQDQFTGYTCANPPAGTSGCTFLARLDLVPGAADNDGAGPVDPTLTALASGNLAGTSVGSSRFYIKVDPSVVGAWTNQIGSQFFNLNFDAFLLPQRADFYSQYTFLHCTAGCPNWNDSTTGRLGENLVGAFQFAVPEPASLGLLGTALLGIGLVWRRRQRR
jgi:hypothetical protein